MNYRLLFHTLCYLRGKQFLYQILKRVHKVSYRNYEAPNTQIPQLKTEPIPRWKCCEEETFTFLNLKQPFSGWSFTGNGMLWAYNQNYFDWINQQGTTEEDGCKWIDKFIEELPDNKVGLDPYPTALRCINWVKFFCRYPDSATKSRMDSLWSQYKLLERKLEFHLLGNHLLEDAYSLFVGAVFFADEKMMEKASNLLLEQLEEQILNDGGHYEQSPMYHCILLDRLLDAINIAGEHTKIENSLREYARCMVGWLKSICYTDGSIPLLNDSALGIAPSPTQIINYARRLNIDTEATPLSESGYRKMKFGIMEVVIDVGRITATYQPGHSHADALNFELQIGGKPFIVDTGITTYDKNSRRQMERSTAAHNTVTIDDRDSSEVWGGFRVGNRATVVVKKEISREKNAEIVAYHDGFGLLHERHFLMDENCFMVSDRCIAEDKKALAMSRCVSHIHFSPLVGIVSLKEDNMIHTQFADIKVTGASAISLTSCEVSTEYNRPQRSTEVLITFVSQCQFSIFPFVQS